MKVRGLDKVRAVFVLAMAAYNIVRLPKLLAPRVKCAQPHEKPEKTASTPDQNLENTPHPAAKNGPCLPLRRRSEFFSSLLSCSPSRALSKRRRSGSAQAL